MKNFAELGVRPDVIAGIATLGFEEPTPVQAKVIPIMLEQQADLMSMAQTGTGKTAAFGLPLVQLVDPGQRKPQGLVLCPTRELCIQVACDLTAFAAKIDGLRILAVYGGAPIEPQIRTIRQGVQIIVATPGRLNDLIRRGAVDLSRVKIAVFDEADEMLQMGFQDELNAIMERTPAEKNTWLFSATMSKGVQTLAGRYMHDPIEITVGKRNAGAENVRHELYRVRAGDRYPALRRIIDNEPDMYAIIFCRTRNETNEIAGKLLEDGLPAEALHGELSQSQRDQVMKKFRTGAIKLLVATDVAARGLDVNDLTHVINYNLPDDIAAYTHRSGRTGRAGRTGISVAIIHLREHFKIKEIEKRLRKKFIECRIPTGQEICRNQLARILDVLSEVTVDHEQIEPLYENLADKVAGLDRDDLLKRVLSLELRRLLPAYKNAPDLNKGVERKPPAGKKQPQGEPGGHRSPGNKFTRLSISIGRRQGFGPQELIGVVNGIPGAGRIRIGKIETMRNKATIEVETRFLPQVMAAFQQIRIKEKKVSIAIDRDQSPASSRNPKRKTRHAGRKPKRSER